MAEHEKTDAGIFVHIAPNDTCVHDFKGWREFEDGRGGEQVCTKCGMGAMEHSLRCGDDWDWPE